MPAVWPGVSSSGSGVAVGAGLAYGAIGTDTGGSIRFPSAANGIVGIKPTYGRVSRHGAFPLAESLDHIGPMTRSVEDAARMLGVLAGHDARDATSIESAVPNYGAAIGESVRGMRIGIDRAYAENGRGSGCRRGAERGACDVDGSRRRHRRGGTTGVRRAGAGLGYHVRRRNVRSRMRSIFRRGARTTVRRSRG